MQPDVAQSDWISRIPVTATGAIDRRALDAAARREQARVVAAFFARLFGAAKRRTASKPQAKAVQGDLDRAALA